VIYLDAEIQQRREAFGKSMKKIRMQAKISQERLAEIANQRLTWLKIDLA